MPGGDVEGLLAAAGGRLEVAARGRDRRGRHPRPRARPCPRHRPSRPEAGERLDRRRRPRPARRLRPGHHRGPLAGQRRHAGRDRRLPAARAGARRGRRPARATSTRSAPCSTRCSPASRRSRATTRSRSSASTCTPTRCRPRGTTRRSPRRSTGPCSRLLAKRPEDRPANAAEARELILAALEEKPAESRRAARPTRSRASPAASSSAASASSSGCARPSTERSPAAARSSCWSGEPGIGKTRAAEELATYARVSGARVYWGRCREDEGAPAYWPWVQAIRSYARDADPVALAWQLGGGAAEVAQLIPEVAEKLDIEPGEGTGQRGGALPPLRLGHQPAAGGRARPAAGDRPRRPALGGRALAAAAPVRGAGARLERPADPRHLPRRRARPPPSARPGPRRDLGHRGQRAHPAARASRSARSSATSR